MSPLPSAKSANPASASSAKVEAVASPEPSLSSEASTAPETAASPMTSETSERSANSETSVTSATPATDAIRISATPATPMTPEAPAPSAAPARSRLSDALLKQLDAVLRDMTSPRREKRLAIAFSGGLDSRFLAFAAQKLGYAPALFHIRGPHVNPAESDFARSWACAHGLPLTERFVNPLEDARIAANDRERCYFCKKTLFTELLSASSPLPLCDGTHASDAQGYRPGRIALRELGIFSPLEAAHFQKADIRRLGAALGLDAPRQKARPCLLTRFPYGVRPEAQILEALARAENRVAELIARNSRTAGLADGEEPDFRLRIVEIRPSSVEVALHVLNNEAFLAAAPDFPQQCSELINAVAPLHLEQVLRADTISGYFDTKRP